jgi:hypothetical protein
MPAFSLWQILDVALQRLRVGIAAALAGTKAYHFWTYAHVRKGAIQRVNVQKSTQGE